MLPTYQLPQSFGRIEMLDEYGLCDISSSVQHTSHTEPPWIEEEGGQISRFRLPGGREASPEDVRQDACAWARAYVRDARSGMVQNHDHDCTDTCVKYANKNSKAGNEENQCQGNQSKLKAASWIVPP